MPYTDHLPAPKPALGPRGVATLMAEYGGMVPPSPLDELVRNKVRQIIDAEANELELIILTDSPVKARRRFTIKRLKGPWRVTLNPWVIKDRDVPAWLGRAPSFETAILVVDNIINERGY